MSALPPKADITAAQTNVRFVPKADNIDDVVIIDGFPLPLAGGGLVVVRLQRHVLHSFALREPRERLLQDHPLEVRRLLVRLERGFVAEHLVEQELRRIAHTPVHRYQLYARLLARLWKEARDDVGAGVRLTVAGPPRHGERQLAVLTGLHVILLSGLALPNVHSSISKCSALGNKCERVGFQSVVAQRKVGSVLEIFL